MERQSATYYQLLTMLSEKPGCPICHLGQQAGRQYLDGLLWESVNDPGIRDELLASLGFCGRHSRELLTFAGERLGVAILQRAVLQEALARLQDVPLPAGRTLFQRLRRELLQAGDRRGAPGQSHRAGKVEEGADVPPCPACLHQTAVEQRALQELLARLVDELDEPLARAGGLCWIHLQQGLQGCGGSPLDAPTRTALLTIHRRLWSELVGHLSEFIRKTDHRFHTEPINETERTAIDRSIAILTGEYTIR